MQSQQTRTSWAALAPIRRLLGILVTRANVQRLALVTAAGMFVVLIMGALVTNTGSAQGCGQSWPLCHGQFIPQFAVSTFIEFSHRAVTGVETLLVLGTTAGALWFWRSRREIQLLAPLMVLFLLAQAALGALAVLYPETPEVLALHFGVSLISFVSIVLTAIFIAEENGADRLRDRPLPAGLRRLIVGLTVYSYVVVYIGAYVRHAQVSLACGDWPLCGGSLYPGFAGGVGIVFTHRIAALVLTIGTVWLFFWARSLRAARPDIYRGSVAALTFVLLQGLDGAFVVYSRLDLFSTLSHSGFVALYFGALCYLCLHTLARQRSVRSIVRPRAVAEPATPTTAPASATR